MRFVAAFAVLSLLSIPAFAQIKTAVPPADDVEAAKAHFAAGSAYYEQANYQDAVKEFNEAYRLSHRSDLLYNIALCYERLAQYDNAIKALEQYLADKPNAPDKVTIETRIANYQKLRDQLAPKPQPAPPPPPAVTPAPVPPPVSSELPRRWWVNGTILTVAGAAVLAASLGTGLGADAIHQDLVKQCSPDNTCPPNLQSKIDEGKSLALASDVLLGVGAATVAVGLVVLLVQRYHHPHTSTQARALPTTSGLLVRF
jgi:tetratricopeptide (TPR) repeat protein